MLDLWRGKISPRKVSVLIRGLSRESATARALNDGEPVWSHTDYILADLVDAEHNTALQVVNKDVPQNKRARAPESYPRPGDEPKKKKISAAALLEHKRRTQGA
ncbi:hypothetical protein [Streptomyces sp. NPDC007063]|uniref:hypothetical protein n=1 Tax=Streptomyces sp. NPDC007063 TaxID=3364772 RepID=UPI0036BB6994